MLPLLLLVPTAEAGDWELRHEKDGITVHTRDVDGSKYKGWKGAVTVEADVGKALATIRDVDAYPAWWPGALEGRVITTESASQTHYVLSDLPWPVTDREAYYRYDVTQGAEQATIKVSTITSGEPERKDAVRAVRATGEWTFRSIGEGRTAVEWVFHFEPGGSLPAWLANSAVVDTPKDVMGALKKKLAGG